MHCFKLKYFNQRCASTPETEQGSSLMTHFSHILAGKAFQSLLSVCCTQMGPANKMFTCWFWWGCPFSGARRCSFDFSHFFPQTDLFLSQDESLIIGLWGKRRHTPERSGYWAFEDPSQKVWTQRWHELGWEAFGCGHLLHVSYCKNSSAKGTSTKQCTWSVQVH